MKKISLVLRHELRSIIARPSFLLMAFGVPLLAAAIFAALHITRQEASDAPVTAPSRPSSRLAVEGYVDHSGLVNALPRDVPRNRLRAFDDEARAKEALASGEITKYYVVPQDYLATGTIYYVYPEGVSLRSWGQDWVMRRTLLFNLLAGDALLTDRVWNPLQLKVTELAPQTQAGVAVGQEDCSRPGFACESNPLVRYLPSIMAVLFFTFFMTGSQELFGNIRKEKENRTIEVLMLSINPRQMLAGKIIGLGIAGLVHTIAWVGTLFVLLQTGGQAFNLPAGFTFPVSILAWALVFFLSGFAVYASLMAGLGALVPNLKESGHASFLVTIPLLAGYGVSIIAPAAEAAHAALPVALSLFPLTAPVVMMMRLSTTTVPAWQPPLAAGLMLLTAYLTIRAVAAMFHAQHLLSGQPFSLKRFLGALSGRT